MQSINKTQVLVGCSALFLGFLLYLLHRSPDTYFISFIKQAHDSSSYGIPISPNAIWGALPSFLHVFAFSLIIGGLLACKKRGFFVICSMWLFINILFELGQKHAIAASRIVPLWFSEVFILENTQNYFLKGTFDFCDILAGFFGALAAYCVLLLTIQNRRA